MRKDLQIRFAMTKKLILSILSKNLFNNGTSMKFVFLCDDIYLKGDYAAFVNNFPTNHELVTMSGEAFLQAKGFPENTFGLLVERFTWQKNFSLFRYFGLLPVLETVPLAVVSRARRFEPLKGRSALRGQEMIVTPNASSEELYTLIDKFVAAPPQMHSYPRCACKVPTKKTAAV